MPPIAQKLREQIQRRTFTGRASEKSWGRAIGLTVVTAVAYFLVARTGLTLLKAEGVAVMWPALGIVTVARLPIGLASAMCRAPPWREQVEGAVAVATLGAISAFVVSLPPGPWATAMPVAVVFPMVLWIAVRCRPVFAAAAAFIV